ncbi:helicase carboxy-terminal domain protein (macronuclear) [Tetrahymena thermophila SB210]|uniref:Helicase carboxy-terminal domain protein n=1 Tax=Tetrahymena thermophila (strain SB210) TaxID=312017 RepID=I7LU06_TETTS|nr:helicase carboxy-terminal domain protein [Tetrahymena thermophila SB210]EAR87661.2 helicase carboxy-terminal domain protein [Tetrahymena thermophila SB210]|eukprot:XP_001007906.2 helicase carboxy-terminal domain protein [Tetrahymena thermophila SB210]
MDFNFIDENNNELNHQRQQNAQQQNQEEIKKSQLEDRLLKYLEELELRNVSSIQGEIEEVQKEIEKYKLKDNQARVSEKEQTLEKLNEIQQMIKQLCEIRNQQLEYQLNEILSELNMRDANLLAEEIGDVKSELENYEMKKRPKKVAEKRKTLEKLINAQQIYFEIQYSNGDPQTILDQLFKQHLEEKLRIGLQELKLEDVDSIEIVIQEVKSEIKQLLSKKKQNQASEKKCNLEKLENLQNIAKELHQLDQQLQIDQKSKKKQQLEQQLDQFMKELELEDVQQIEEEIQQILEKIEKYSQRKENSKVSQEEQTLSKLKNCQLIYLDLQKLNDEANLNNSNLKEIINQNSEMELDFTNQIYQQEDPNQRDNQILDLNTKFNVKYLKQDASQIPYSSEKLLTEMLIFCIELLTSNGIKIADEYYSQVLNFLLEIENRLKIEDQLGPEILQSIQCLKLSIDHDNLKQFIVDTEKLLKKIRPLNVNEMNRLINEANKASNIMKGQDIILFLGNTGAGKSTTVHFLSGSRMVKLKSEFIDYIGPDPNKILNKSLQKVKIGVQAQSETRYITPVQVHYQDVQMNQKGHFILCDVPGFGDTAGPEVDIANGIGIVEAIKQCKSVRPVILLSFKSTGDKGQGIKDLAHLLLGLIQNPDDNLSLFTYLFTKFPQDVDINKELKNIKKSIEESSDKAFISLFEDMIYQTEKGCCRVEPLTNQPQVLLKQILKKQGVDDPSQIFKFSITQNSQSVIQDQALKTQQMIISAVSRCEYELINYQLNKLKFLVDTLNQNSIKQTYEKCKKLIIDNFNTYYNNAISQLDQSIQNQNKLDIQYLYQFQDLVNKSKNLEQLRSQHLGNEVMQYDSLIQQLKLSVQKMANVFNQDDNITKFASNNIDNIKLISEIFPEIKQQYGNSCQLIMKKIESLLILCKQTIKNKNYDQLSMQLSQIKSYQIEFKNHLNEQSINEELNNVKKQFYDIFVNIIEQSNHTLEKKELQIQDIDNLNRHFQDFGDVEKNLKLIQHFSTDQISKYKKNFINNLVKHFEKIIKQIEDTLKLEPEQAFQKLEILVYQMKQFRQINTIDHLTSDKYYKSIQDVEGLMQSIKRQIDQYLNDFQHDKKKVDFQKVYRCLIQLKSAEWMDGVQKGIYEQKIKGITDELFKYSQFQIITKLVDLDLSCKNYQNISVASELLIEMERMQVFEEFNIKLKELRETAEKKFSNSIESVFNQIKELISKYNKFLNLRMEGSFLIQPQNTETSEEQEEEKENIQNKINSSKYCLANDNQIQQKKSIKCSKQIIKNNIVKIKRESKRFIQIEHQSKLKNKQNFFPIKIDMNQIEDYLVYIENCCTSKWIRLDANTLKDKLKQLLVQYGNSLKVQIQQYFQIITEANEQNDNEKSLASQKLATQAQELMELQNYKMTCQLVQGGQILKDLKNLMQQHYLELYDQLNQTSLEKQFQAQIIRIIKQLIHTENILGDNKFYNLYKNQQIEINNEYKGIYQKIIEQIELNQYQNASFELLSIDDKSANEKAMKQIRLTLVTSVELLLDKAQDKQSYLENQIQKDLINQIVQIIEQIKKAKQCLQDYFEKEFLDNVDRQVDQIIIDIQNKIEQYLESMSAHVKQLDFFQVEEKREHIMQIILLLSRYNSQTKEEINKKLNQLQKELEEKVKQITQIDYNDQNNLIHKPPKFILEKLSKVSSRNIKYAECYDKLNKILIDRVSNSILDYQNSIQQEQNQKELKIQTLINSLPDDLKLQSQDQFNSVKQFIKQKNDVFEKDFKQAEKSKDLDKKLKFMEQCSQEKMFSFQDKMSKQIQQECQKYSSQLTDYLGKNEIKESIQQAIKLLENKNKFLDYKKKFGEEKDRIEEFEKMYSELEKAISSNYESARRAIQSDISMSFESLKAIKTIEDQDSYQKEYDKLQSFIINLKDYEKYFLINDFNTKIKSLGFEIYNFFEKIFKSFNDNLKDMKIKKIKQDLLLISKWENFIQKIVMDVKKQNIFTEQFLNDYQITQFKEKYHSYKDCIEKFINQIQEVKQNVINFKFQDDYQMHSQHQELKKDVNILIQLKEEKIDFQSTQLDYECYEKECLPKLISKIEEFQKEIEIILESQEKQFSENEFKMFNKYYDNLNQFNENVKNLNIDIEYYKRRISQKLEQKIENLFQSIDVTQIDSVAKSLILIKTYSENIPSFKKNFDCRLDIWIKNIYFNEFKGMKLAQLVTHLQREKTGIGIIIIEEHDIFKQQSISIFNKQVKEQGIKYVLENIKGEDLNKEKLDNVYNKFLKQYEDIVQNNIICIENKSQSEKIVIESLAYKVKSFAKKIELKNKQIKWDNSVRQNIPSLMAHIFALWTFLNMEYFKELTHMAKEEKETYLFSPHAGQIISIFRLLGLGYQTDGLQNNFIQIGTGEGKSIVLAVTAIIFALHEVDVYCACYSQYLSERDYESFLKLFNILGVIQNIKYGAFTKICEHFINQQGDIRQLTADYICNGFSENKKKTKKTTKNPSILIIDEVDVFFTKDFYGSMYNPVARLQDENIVKLAEFIWQSRKQHLFLEKIQQTNFYKQCINKFKNLRTIIDECLKDMISDSKNFSHDYLVLNDRICYKEQDRVSFDINYGYKTLFAYFYEQEKGQISLKSLQENTFILLRCGSFSYSEIPFQFENIIGVTGTLETLNDFEKNIVQKIFKITKSTFIPSVFGKNKRKFAQKDDTYVESEDDYFKILREKIEKSLYRNEQKRAVLLFFETEQQLLKFYNSPELNDLKYNINIITEQISNYNYVEKIKQLIKKSTIQGQITLLTSSFGRGTDFKCSDQQVLDNGGVHVIQTFFSSKKSEEIQIMGRCARQGAEGSYSLVLLDSDLEKILGADYRKAIEQIRQNNNFYEVLDKKRNEIECLEYTNYHKYIDQIKQKHIEGQQYINSLVSQNENQVQEFLLKNNKGSNDIQNLIRILCLVDGTSSMGLVLNKVKTEISVMLERSCQIIINSEKNIPEDCFQIQFAVYRDYDQMNEGILQVSPWESKAENLKQFLEQITPKGGEDYEEAIEIGLQHANQENSKYPLSAIILIADAPAKSLSQIKNYRKKYGGEDYWKKTKFSQITDFQAEIEKIKKVKIPVHCFYLNYGAKENFTQISSQTGGKCESLDINSSQASQKLIQFVVEPILVNVGKQNGVGDSLYQKYLKIYSKSYIRVSE